MVSIRDRRSLTEPLSNEPELENLLHLAQLILLMDSLEWWWQDRQNFFVAGNLSIDHKPEQLKRNTYLPGTRFFRGFGHGATTPSWLVEKEGKFSNLIVEVLSLLPQKSPLLHTCSPLVAH